MTKLSPQSSNKVFAKLKAAQITLIDIRESDEFAREHIEGAISMPLSALESGRMQIVSELDVVFHCRSGMRTESNCGPLASYVGKPASVLDGGLDAWKQTGLPTKTDMAAPMEINRQVQISIGGIILFGVLAALTIDPSFVWLSGLVGAGLVFAGLSGWCGMASLLSKAPWNNREMG